MNKKAYLLLGSNLGDREGNLLRARGLIMEKAGEILQSSKIYETAAWGKIDQPAFLNQVITVNTTHEAQALLGQLLDIERMLGRERIIKWGKRTIDIDILLYGNEVINHPNLVIPHPGIAQRRFTLLPLVEVSAHLVHPVLKKTMAQLLTACTDLLPVVPYIKGSQQH